MPSLKNLKQLKSIDISGNDIHTLDSDFVSPHFYALKTLKVSGNPLNALPAEIAMLVNLKVLEVEGCAFHELDMTLTVRTAYSLKEMCARVVHTNGMEVYPESVCEMMNAAKNCSHCEGVYFDECIDRYRIWVRDGFRIPIHYRLCTSHWVNNKERIACLFN